MISDDDIYISVIHLQVASSLSNNMYFAKKFSSFAKVLF